ncbi:alpha/beta fold hydrolase [Agrobacterium fabrum]|uniref:alpha/beta fold hydrolase n=1 Tax=Agrobacterium fabrum TaxID=1176649 RepID=UPI001572A5FA|nr:alpha/beta hydrolase [Agrobacterium fabrum]WCK80181.1 alpha/beta hydrolase [Agrobacterium fabrum]
MIADQTPTYEQFPAQVQTTEIDGLKIRYAHAPRAGAETLLLLSPWPESIFAYVPTWAAFSARYDVLALDLPGFGQSEGRPDVIAPKAMGEFIAKAVRHFALKTPHAIGPDVGTSSLLFAAASNPGLFASITVGNGAVAYPLEVGSALSDLIAAPSLDVFKGLDVAAFVDSVLGSLQNYAPPAFVRDDYIASYAGEERLAESTRLVRRYPEELELLKEHLGGIQTPVLVISSRHDPFVPFSNGQYLSDRLPAARHEIIDAGHLVWEDAADEYAGCVLDWVKEHGNR